MKYLNIKKALEVWQNLQPLSEKDKDRLSRRFTVDFNYNSNHIEGNTLTYGQTEILLLFGKVIGEADVRDVQEMTASNVGLRMMSEEAAMKEIPLTQNFIRTLHRTLLREDYTVYRNLPGGVQTSYVVQPALYAGACLGAGRLHHLRRQNAGADQFAGYGGRERRCI